MGDDPVLDRWAAWLLHRRDGDDPEQRAKALEHLVPIRDRVLDNARILPGEVVLDVGAGDGLIGFGAAERVGSVGRVIFSDVSEGLLAHARSLAGEMGVTGVEFVRADAADLAPVPDASVDVVTSRSVLIYVREKAKAFRAFHRVLRPGGRLSLFEPVNNYFEELGEEFWGFDTRPIRDLVAKVWEYEGRNEADEDDPMMNFTEKDLLRYAEDVGFREVHVELRVDVEPGTWVVDWNRLLETSPNPNAHTVGESLHGALTQEEFRRFEEYLRPLVDDGRAVKRSAWAYLSASV